MQYLSTPEKAYMFLRSVWPSEITTREKVMIIYLDKHLKTIGHECLFVGGMDSCTLDTRIVFQYAIREMAHQILIVHNHPSGNLTPSREDIQVTEQLKAGGKVLGIPVGHMIITDQNFKVLAFFD